MKFVFVDFSGSRMAELTNDTLIFNYFWI